MIKKVLKFGGTSVGSIERIQHVANIIKKEHELDIKYSSRVGHGQTNELIGKSSYLMSLINES